VTSDVLTGLFMNFINNPMAKMAPNGPVIRQSNTKRV